MPCGITCKKIGRHCHAAHCVYETTCVAERYPTLRICRNMGAHYAPLRKKKSSAVPFFAAVTCRQSAPDYPRERGDPQEGGNRRCLPSCAPARRQRRCLPSCAPARRQRNFPRFASDAPAVLHQNAKEEHCCLAVSLFTHITVFCFPDLSAVPHGGALLRSQEA